MKYLKLFEKYADVATIKYILMDLNDIGYKTKVDNYKEKYVVTITNNKGINNDEVYPIITHLSSYMKSEGYITDKDKSHKAFNPVRDHKTQIVVVEYKFNALALLKSKKK